MREAQAVLAALEDLDGSTVTRDDSDGYAGTFMAALFGGDTGRAEDWQEAWRWSDRFTGRADALEARTEA